MVVLFFWANDIKCSKVPTSILSVSNFSMPSLKGLFKEEKKKGPNTMITWVRKIPWRRKWQPIPVILPEKFPWTEEPGGIQSMVSESDATE